MPPKSAAALAAAPDNPTPPEAPLPLWLSVAQVADEVQMSTKTVRRRIADGTLPARRVGGLIRVHRDDVAAIGRPIPSAAI